MRRLEFLINTTQSIYTRKNCKPFFGGKLKGEYALSSWAISNPTFIKKEGTVRITAILWESDKEYELWYEVPDSIERYLFSDCLDAFLVAVLPIVSMKGCNLELKGCVSEKLYHSLLDNVIPLLNNITSKFYKYKFNYINHKKLPIYQKKINLN